MYFLPSFTKHLARRTPTFRRRCSRMLATSLLSAFALCPPALLQAQEAANPPAAIHYDAASHIFRIDAADISYVLGVNEKSELQMLYWGKRLGVHETFAAAHSEAGASAFDLPSPKEFAGWGGGVYTVPDLKITFPDGNRDLVLHYLSHTIDGDTLTITLKDIERDVRVELTYAVDPTTGVLRPLVPHREGNQAALHDRRSLLCQLEPAPRS